MDLKAEVAITDLTIEKRQAEAQLAQNKVKAQVNMQLFGKIFANVVGKKKAAELKADAKAAETELLKQEEKVKALEDLLVDMIDKRKAENDDVEFAAVTGIGKTECVREWQRLKTLGKGSFGTVSQVCENGDAKKCKYVMKIQTVVGHINAREPYFLGLVNKLAPNIAPKMHSHWQCGTPLKMFIIMDLYSSDLDKMVKDPKFGWHVELTENELLRMFAICEVLGELNIVTGDQKPNNFLIDNRTGHVVFSDYGLAGYINLEKAKQSGAKELWSPIHGFSFRYGCGDHAAITLEHPMYKFLPVLNALQLYTFLRTEGTMIRTKNGERKVLLNIPWIPKDIIQDFWKTCSEIENAYTPAARAFNKTTKPEEIYYWDVKTYFELVEFYGKRQ